MALFNDVIVNYPVPVPCSMYHTYDLDPRLNIYEITRAGQLILRRMWNRVDFQI
jgi:hypothetical protein